MFTSVGSPRRTRQNGGDGPHTLAPNSTAPLIAHFPSPYVSDDHHSNAGVPSLPQTQLTDRSLLFSTLQQTSTSSLVSDRPHLPPDESWNATASDEYAEDSPYIPPVPSSSTSKRPPEASYLSLAVPSFSEESRSDSYLYDQPEYSNIDQPDSPHSSEHSHASGSPRSSAPYENEATASRSRSSGESESYLAETHHEPLRRAQPQTPLQSSAHQAFSSILYPAYDENNHRIGLEHTRADAKEHIPTGRSYYRAQTRTYGALASPPQVDQGSREAIVVRPQHPQSPPRQQPKKQVALPKNQTPAARPARRTFSHQVPVEEIPDPEPNLRQMLGLGPDQEINLSVLDDPLPGEKPNYPYPVLAKLAIHGSEKKKLTLQEIYAALEDRFQWFRQSTADSAWKRSIRHLLSLNKTFRKIPRPVTDPGKGSYWIVDYSQGEGNKRARKRNKKPTKAQLARQAAEARRAGPSTVGSAAGSSHCARSDSEMSHSSGIATSGGFDQSVIDPTLTDKSHRVGMQRTNTRTKVRADPPYTSRISSNAGSSTPEPPVFHTSLISNVSEIRGSHQLSNSSLTAPNLAAFGRPSFGISSSSGLGSTLSVPGNKEVAFAASAIQPSNVDSAESTSVGRGFSGYQASNASFLQGRALPAPVQGGRAAARARHSDERVKSTSNAVVTLGRSMSREGDPSSSDSDEDMTITKTRSGRGS